MEIYLHCVRNTETKVWGLSPCERIARVLGPDVKWTEDPDQVPQGARVLIFRGDHIYDDRLIRFLAEHPGTFIKATGHDSAPVVAACASGADAGMAAMVVDFRARPGLLTHFSIHAPDSLPVSFFQSLKKHEPPFIIPVDEATARDAEDRLFDWSYKGITDLVTKWLWPAPAKAAVRFCVRHGITPNQVTLASLVLVVLTGLLFYQGHLGLGLLAGWLMTFLDTVDGKLARVTVRSSKFGHYFDHLIDLIHQPIWYILWGYGVVKTGAYLLEVPPEELYGQILFWYVAGRLAEGAFQLFAARFSIFCWRPIDSFFRLILARRNPCMLLLTLFWIGGRPDTGLYAVALWMKLSAIFLMVRTTMALLHKWRGEPPVSWLAQEEETKKNGLACRWFVKR